MSLNNLLKKLGHRSKEQKQTKICSVKDCGRILGSHNLSGLCHGHILDLYNHNKIKRFKRDHKCYNCGKDVEPIKCPHCFEILKYPSRCKSCFEKIKKLAELKKKTKELKEN